MRGIAAFPQSTSPRFVDVAEPREPADCEVLCRTLELGVCGTDREILLSKRPLVPAGDAHLILGHECLAQIEQVGPGVTDLAVGDLVVPAVRRARERERGGEGEKGRGGDGPHAIHCRSLPLPTSPSLPPSLGPLNDRVDLLAFGQYTERGIVEEHGFSTPWWTDRPEHLFKIEPELAPWAVLTEPFSVAEKGANEALCVQQARLGSNAWQATPPRVLVTGLGPIGFAAAAVSLCRGWPTTVYGRDAVDTFRAQLVVALGAEYLPAEQAELTSRDVERQGFDLVLEATGSDEVMVEAARSLAARGVMVWLGSSRQPKPLTLNVAQMMRDGVLRNHIHIGCVNAAPRDFREALAHLDQLRRSHPRELSSLITARVPRAEALWHYEQRQPQGIKTVVEVGQMQNVR